MDFCRTVDVLYGALPLRPFRDWLIRVHMERCPRCQARLLSRDEAKSLLVGPDQVGDAGGLWRRISREGGRVSSVGGLKPARGLLSLRWAGAVALAAVVALAGFWLLREIDRSGFDANAVASAERFEIDYIRVGGAPARTFVYQPQGTDTVFVWASRTP